ncbi:alanyl-tRNA synthetase [Oceanobacillus limi]|uniref:Alanine--tRNA ligase n=1 Tax=Oceanobacillus limi TaxID=930131 RepID=A0A1I0FFU1_9BACI|nr:DHHA1 domain-containing protein [Oceanobacillus limi]SET56785.1 alanyl-tRNA synthetase [Oceanobacillus limi]
METEKLFYHDPYLCSFKAKIQLAKRDEQGRHYVVLDQTAFYPIGGGQPHDTGTLDGMHVDDVKEVEGELRHYVDESFEFGKEIIGEIDWKRRFDHMQQHAGQHILSAAFEETYGHKTISFHLGKEICSIDIHTNELMDGELHKVEELANRIILENRPIETKWVSKDELANYTLRKELSVSNNIRLVIIPDFDYNGCGGTHPNSTGQVSSIKILHWEKQKKNIRVYFVCGNRVLKQLEEKHGVIQKLTASLSAPQEELEIAANRVLQQSKEYEKSISELKQKLMHHEADSLLSQATLIKDRRVVKSVFQNRPMQELQYIAKYITGKTSDHLVLFVNNADKKLQFVCASGESLPNDMNKLVKRVLPKIDGKGGGTKHIAQGGSEHVITAEELMELLVCEI